MFANLSFNSGLVVSAVLVVCCVALLMISIGMFTGHVATHSAAQIIARGLLEELKACGEKEGHRQLPPEITDPIKPFLAPGSAIPADPNEVRELYSQACDFLAEREQFARQEAATIAAHTELETAQARAVFLASISQQERALLDARLKAQAEAEANEHLSSDYEALRKQHLALRTQVDALIADKELLASENAQLRVHAASAPRAPHRPKHRRARARRDCVCDE